MFTAIRLACSIAAGLAVAFVLVNAVELFSSIVHPIPPDFSGKMEEMCQHVANYPHWILAVVVAAWGGTTFLSTWIATRIGNRGCGAFVGLVLLAAIVLNISMLPYPMWFKLALLIVIPATILLCLRPPRRESKATLAVEP